MQGRARPGGAMNGEWTALREENAMLRQEIRVAREAAEISAQLVVKQFEETEAVLHLFQAATAQRQAVFDAAQQVSIVAADLGGKVVLFSRGAEALLGYTAKEALAGLSVLDIHVEAELAERIDASRGLPGRPAADMDVFAQYAAQASSGVREWTYRCKNGSRFPVSLSITLLRDADGARAGYVCVAMDMSSRKQAEEELKRAKDAAEAANSMKGQFLANVSHELRTPLTSIMGFAKLIGKDFSRLFLPLVGEEEKLRQRAERVGQNLAVIVREGERLTRLINDVLDLAKIEAGRIEWRDAPVSVKELVDNALQAVSGQFANMPAVDLKVKVAAGLPGIVADRDRLMQVLINLLNNAAKFTRAGSVEVTAGLNGKGEIQIGVRDSGIGIPAEYLDKVFDNFQQVAGDTLSDKPQGTGLGLPISRQIIQHYGGRIWAESRYGEGSTFTFTLPVPPAGEEAEASPAAEETAGLPLILVVDDDPGIRGLLAQLLEDAGYRIVTAADGREALELARRHRPDLITMDLMMPGMDGYTAIECLRKDELLHAIPIVVISVLGESGGVESDATLKKPVDEELLLRAIHALLKSEPNGAQHCLVLRPGREDFALPSLSIRHMEMVDEDSLWERLDAGFGGTVVVTHGVLADVFERLSRYGAVQVIIVPLGPHDAAA